ncbi:E3 ubiquitin-protein ligase COP1-like isoform X1 [Ctenocephalides felis]|uniref:E3 ubiquitin-protein ligase COP1-like isoform X1 n=1 Tax=Ctenocephalides felis TaxID=7515 RepID=UPI000E6E31A8|nr:E3 ubiquitin-protein ligase COP1-like isoform X1 [Ctenocephalides felis]
MSLEQDYTGSGSSLNNLSRPLKRQHPSSILKTIHNADAQNGDFLCPVCFDTIREAHITKCGHTFCYDCIFQAIENLRRCPKCSRTINSADDIIPNFLLNDVITKHRLLSPDLQHDGPGDILRDFVTSESQKLSLPDVNVMLEVLTQRKHLLEAESCAAQNRLLYEFLKHLLELKEEQKLQIAKEVALIKKDMGEVENILHNVQQKCPTAEEVEKVVGSDASVVIMKQELLNMINNAVYSSDIPRAESDSKGPNVDIEGFNTGQQNYNIATSLAARRKRMYAHFDDFVQCYFSSRAKDLYFSADSTSTKLNPKVPEPETTVNSYVGLDVFRENLVKFSRYNSLRPLATLSYSSDMFNNSTIVSSIEFDKDNEFFAIAGVTKRIKVFDYGAVIKDTVDIHYPCVEMLSSSKISCISWNNYHKGTLASSDYEGTITVWDATTGIRLKTFQEHDKRCWSVDFNNVDTRLIASGSDDARVKLWSLNVDHSVATLEVKANVCCVKFNPNSSYHLAFGAADHCVHYYDLRNMKGPLSIFKGHRKAVSYVKFINSEEIVSASTDSQLKMWNVNTPYCLRTFVGHINEKNFVGLATDGDYVACGSENNSLYVYFKGLTKQLFSFKFDAARSVLDCERKEEEPNEFVSAVCWRQSSNVVVAANSQGIIKILELV